MSTMANICSKLTLPLFLCLATTVKAGVIVVQNVAPGATSWPGSPFLNTMANPSSANVTICFTNRFGTNSFGQEIGGNTNMAQTFTIVTTNYVLQQISIYAGDGSGTDVGTNLILRLHDLGFQTGPEPAPYGAPAPNETLVANLLGGAAGLPINYTNQPNGILEFDFTGTDQVLLQAGHMYAFELTGTVRTRPVNWLCRTSGSTYSAGAAYTNKFWLNGNTSCEFPLAVYGVVTNYSPPAPTPLTAQSTVNWTDIRQRIDGFGASSAWGSSFTTAQADMLFSTNTGIGLSLLRSRIAPGGTTVENAIMQMAQARGARVWSAPWTPPTTFKGTNALGQISLNGGKFLGGDATNRAYASQLAGYVANMKNLYGINLYAISVQNEPDHNDTGYESCVWTNSQIHDFVPYLANALVASNVGSTKIMLGESQNWPDYQGLKTTAMNDPAVAPLVGIIADHNYDGATGPASLTKNSYGKPLWETEVSLLSGSGSSMYNGVYWAGRIHLFFTVGQVNAWHHWWLISGNSTPNQGLLSSSQSPTKRMYALGQFSKFVRPNFYRIGVTTNSGTTFVSAYKDPNSGKFAIVAINPNLTNSADLTVNLSNFGAGSVSSVTPWVTSSSQSIASQSAVAVSGTSFTYNIPGPGIVTFVGTGGPTNSAPTALALSNSSILEQLPPGTTIGSFNSTDPDAGSTFTYSLVAGTGGGDNGSFSISGNSLLSAAMFDYQTKSSYTIRVRTTDQYGLYYEQPFTITVISLPAIRATLEQGQLVLRWPLNNAGFQLKYTTNLQNGVWLPVPASPSTNGQDFIFTNSYNDAAGFYRLSLP